VHNNFLIWPKPTNAIYSDLTDLLELLQYENLPYLTSTKIVWDWKESYCI
jgi:hypothetical protein